MSEFRGTKGKWEKLYIKTSSGGYYKIISENLSICNIITRNEDQAEANAKLILCTPEMLEFLYRIESSENTPSEHRRQAKQLIKKAT